MSEQNIDQNVREEPDESTRLLSDAERGSTAGTPASRARRITPLPKAQLGALVAVRVVDPIAYTQIFPYINQLLADFHIAPPDQVGFYSGFVESGYSLAEMLSVYQWGRLSDVIGRRPVFIFGLVGIAVSTIAFGLSTSLAAIIVSRFLGGLVAGNIAVLHSILVEITDETNVVVAVPIYALSWATGSILGSLIGGTFPNAATRYPEYFSWPIFVEYPYLPPCVVTAACALLGAVLGYFLIEETLPSKQKGTASSVSSSAPGSTTRSTETESTSVKALLAIPAIRALTLSALALSFLGSAFEALFTLLCYTPVDAGGLGLKPSAIGNFLAFAGTIAILLRLLAMPYILHRFDYAATYKTCMYLWPLTFAFLPLFNVLVRARPVALGTETAPTTMTTTATTTAMEVGIWIGLALVLALARVAAIPFNITMLLVKRHAPTSAPVLVVDSDTTGGAELPPAAAPSTAVAPVPAPATATATGKGRGSALGRGNGLVQFALCLGRAIGPVVANTLFTALNGSTWANERGIGWAWSVVMVCFAFVGARMTKEIR